MEIVTDPTCYTMPHDAARCRTVPHTCDLYAERVQAQSGCAGISWHRDTSCRLRVIVLSSAWQALPPLKGAVVRRCMSPGSPRRLLR
jgi:hypothetical protein